MQITIQSIDESLIGRYKVLFLFSSPFEELFRHKFDLIVIKNNLPYFIQKPATISPIDQKVLGNHYITYILTDGKYGQTNYTQKIIIQKPIYNTIKETQNQSAIAIETVFHLPSIISIDNIGIVTVKFGRSIKVDYMKEAGQTVRNFIEIGLTNQNNLKNYELISLSLNELMIKMNFNNPLLISQQDEKDELNMIFYGKIVGIGDDFKKVKILSLQHEIPKQLSSVDEQLYLNRTSGILQSIVITLVTTNAGLTLIQSVGMQFVWGFLNTQQILSHVQLFNLNMPSNINYFYDLIQGSLKFQIYNALPITQFIFSIDQDDKPFNQAFADFGYDQTSLILNLDMLFYIYLLYPIDKRQELLKKDSILQVFDKANQRILFGYAYFNYDLYDRIQVSKSKQFPSQIRVVACNYYTSMLVQIKPYDDKYEYLLEFFNEVIILLLSELILIIEASPVNGEGKQQIGWIYISIIGFCALSNFIFYLKVTGCYAVQQKHNEFSSKYLISLNDELDHSVEVYERRRQSNNDAQQCTT
eukprot:403345218